MSALEIVLIETWVRKDGATVKVRRVSLVGGQEWWSVDGGAGTERTVEGYEAAIHLAGEIVVPLSEAEGLRRLASAADERARAAAWKVRDDAHG